MPEEDVASTPTTPVADPPEAQNVPTETVGADGQTPEEPTRVPWFQKRIDELTRARREAERRADALESLIASKGTSPETTPGVALPDQEIQRRAQAIADQQLLNTEANRVYHEGKGKHPDFDRAVSELGKVADLTQKPEFLEAITRLPNGADVYHHLGTHLDHASEILSLKGTSMAIELAKLSADLGKPRKGTAAPPPISPLGSSSVPSGDLSDDLPIGEWIQRREAALKKR